MNYLITGGAGFIGSSLANHLISERNSVTVIDDLSMGKRDNLNNSKIKFIRGNVCDKRLIEGILESEQFDYVFLIAAIASVADSVSRPLQTHKVNFESILGCLDLIRNTQNHLKRVVFTSSAAVYGDEPTLPKSEESIIRPLTPYAIDKFAAEKYVLAYNNLYDIPTSAVRFFNVYGMNQNPQSEYSGVISIISDKFNQMIKGKKTSFDLFGDGKQSRDFVFIKDVIQALLIVAESSESKGKVFNVGTGKATSLNEVISVFEMVTNTKLKVNYLESREGDIKNSVADISNLCSLGYHARYDLLEGISEYFDYVMKENNHSQFKF